MATTSNRILRLTFLTAGGKTFAITVDHPRTDLTAAEAEAVMETTIAKNIFSTPSGELSGIRDIKVIDTTTEDLYDPPLA